MATQTKWIVGFLVLVVLSASIYIMLPNNVRLDVGKSSSIFKVWENDSWITSATEYVDVYSGTSKLGILSYNLTKEISGTNAKIIRTRILTDGIKVIDTYSFDGSTTNVELFPIHHTIEVEGAKDKILQFKVSGLYGDVPSREAKSPESFGKNMKVYWQDGAYYQKIVYSKTTQKDTLTVKYKITNDSQIFNVRVFDPPFSETYSSTSTGFWNRTEGTNLGARLNAPVLFMDFNNPAESPIGTYLNSGGTYVKDGSVYNNYGTVTGNNASSQWVAGNWSNALQFDGTNDYVNVGKTNLNFSKNDSFSVFVWINSPNLQTLGGQIVGKMSSAVKGWAIQTYGTSGIRVLLISAWSANSAVSYTTAPAVNDGKWHQVGFTYNGSSNATGIKIYIDGTNATTVIHLNGLTSDITNTDNAGLGFAGGFSYYRGSMDEVMIFNRTLDATEISNLYLNQSANIDDALVNDASLVSYWRLNETAGTRAVDSQGRNNGTLINFDASTPTYNSTGGYDGSGAYVFDGGKSYINGGIAPTITGPFTLSLWLKRAGANGDEGTIMDVGSYAAGGTGFGLWIGSAERLSWRINGDYNHYKSSLSPTIDVWEYDTVVYNGSTISMYKNGTLITSDSITTNPNSATTFILGKRADWTTGFNGTIDQVQIFNRALSADEVLNLYNGTRNNSNYIGKYNLQGDFSSGVFYNSTQTYWNTTLSLADSSTVYNNSIANNAGINLSNPNLVSYWNFDGNFNDAKGINNGTPINGVNNATGISSGAMRFDGGNDYVNTPLHADPAVIPLTTWSAWIYPTLFNARIFVLSTDDGNYDRGIGTEQTTGRFFAGAGYGYVYGTALTLNQWHHIAAAYNATYVSLYQDGVLSGGGASAGMATVYNVTIGVNPSFGGYFTGMMDEILIYNSTFSANEITSLYKSGLSQHANTNVTIQTRTANTYNITDPSLVSFWSFNNATNITLLDETGRNNGTYLNGALSNSSSGLIGNGGRFDGTNDFVNTTFTQSQNITNNLSVFVWVQGSVQADRGILTKYDYGATKRGWTIGTSTAGTNKLKVAVSADGGTTNFKNYESSNIVFDNKWHYVGFVFNTNNLTMYIDGKIETSPTKINDATVNSILNSNIQIVIGSYLNNGASSLNFNGLIDEVRIYNRSLSASEVLDLYNLGATHIDWSAWNTDSTVSDGIPITTSSSGKFLQFKANLESNDTDVSPYVNNYSILNLPPVITFNNLSSEKSFAISQFVKRNGTNFTLAGERYTFTGINAYPMIDYATNHTYDDAGNEINNSWIYAEELLDKARYNKVNVLRLWGNMMGGGCENYNSSACWRINQTGGHYNLFEVNVPGNYSEDMFAAQDKVIYEASQRDIRVLPVYVNNWKEYGGMRWYVQQSPTTNKTYANVSSDSEDNWWIFHDQFYSDPNCKQYYKNFLNYTLNRTNIYSGIQYKNDPAIFAIMLANEPRAKSKGASAELIKNWTTEMTAFVKSIDSNHLVGMGVEGIGLNESWGDGENMIDVHQTTGVDFATFAMHPNSWDWFVQRGENSTDGGWLTGGVADNRTIDFWTKGSGYTLNNRYAGGVPYGSCGGAGNSYSPCWIPKYSRHGYQNWVAMNTNISNSLGLPVIAQEVAYPTNQPKALRDKFLQQGIYSFFNEGGDGFMLWNFNWDYYWYSTAGSTCNNSQTGVVGAGCMDDEYSFYYSSDPFLKNKSQSNIDAFSFAQTNNTGGTSWVTSLNDRKYNIYFTPQLNLNIPANCSLFLNVTNTSNQSTNYYRDQLNTSEIIDGNQSMFTKQFDSTDKEFYWYIECCKTTGECYTSTPTYQLMEIAPEITLTGPVDNFISTNSTFFTLNYTVHDNLGISSCDLYLDGALNQTNTSISVDVNQNFYVNVSSKYASHNWYVRCIDTSGAVGLSEIRTFSTDYVDINFVSPTTSIGSYAQNYIDANVTAAHTYSISFINITLYDASKILYSAYTRYESQTYKRFDGLATGIYYLNATACNIIGNCSSTETREITLTSSSGPVITIESPLAQTYSVNSTWFNVTVDSATNCWFNLDSVGNKTMLNDTLTHYYNYTTDIACGIHNIVFYCNNSAGLTGTADRTFGIDIIPPQITLHHPLTTTYLNSNSVLFNYTPISETFELDSCKLYGNWSGNWIEENSTDSPINASVNNFTEIILDGTYIWNIECNDSNGLSDWSSQGNQTFVVDTVAPNINVLSPIKDTTYYTTTIFFNATADESISSWMIDYNGANQTITINSSKELTQGIYSLKMYATDLAGNIGTNLSVTNFMIELRPSIEFVEPTTATGSYIQDWIYVNISASYPSGLNWINYYLYNSVGTLVTNGTSPTSPLDVNITGLGDDTYYLNATALSIMGGVNNTETRAIKLDTTIPVITLNYPTSGSYYNDYTGYINLTINEDGGNCSLNDTRWTYHDGNLRDYNFFNTQTLGGTCYQETANVSTVCGGKATGTYSCTGSWDNGNSRPCSNVYDTNWSSIGQASSGNDAYLYINYSIPTGAVSSSVWNVKDGGGNKSLSLDADCWQNPLQLYVYSDYTGGDIVEWRCKNTTGSWKLLGTEMANPQVFEEGMLWNITTSLLPDGLYSINASCWDQTGNNASLEFNFTIDTTSPSIEYVTPPTPVNGSSLTQNWTIINVTFVELNFQNITFSIWNDTWSDNHTFYMPTYGYNWTDLALGTYQFQVSYIYDAAGNSNSTEVRTVTLTSGAPPGTIWIYPNSNYTNSLWFIDFGRNGSSSVPDYDSTLCGTIGGATQYINASKLGTYALSYSAQSGQPGSSEKSRFGITTWPRRFYSNSFRIFFSFNETLVANVTTQVQFNISTMLESTGITDGYNTTTVRLYRSNRNGGIYNDSLLCYEQPVSVG